MERRFPSGLATCLVADRCCPKIGFSQISARQKIIRQANRRLHHCCRNIAPASRAGEPIGSFAGQRKASVGRYQRDRHFPGIALPNLDARNSRWRQRGNPIPRAFNGPDHVTHCATMNGIGFNALPNPIICSGNERSRHTALTCVVQKPANDQRVSLPLIPRSSLFPTFPVIMLLLLLPCPKMLALPVRVRLRTWLSSGIV